MAAPLLDERRDDLADELLTLARPLIETRLGVSKIFDRVHDLPLGGGQAQAEVTAILGRATSLPPTARSVARR